MGMCNQCCEQKQYEEVEALKTRHLKAGPQFNGVNFTFTNRPLNELKGDCIVFYADRVSELSFDQTLNRMSKRLKRKLTEYLIICEEQMQRNKTHKELIPITVPNLHFKYLLLVKVEPWDGVSKAQIQRKILDLTEGYLEVFKLRKINSFTVAQFDELSGIHYSMSFPALSQAFKRHASDFKNITILCESRQSLDYYHKNTRQFSKNTDFTTKKKKKKRQTLDDIIY